MSALLAADGTLHSLLQVARLKGMPEPDVLHPAQVAARLKETSVSCCTALGVRAASVPLFKVQGATHAMIHGPESDHAREGHIPDA